jgi:uncharacterized protein (TIGR03118 family)
MLQVALLTAAGAVAATPAGNAYYQHNLVSDTAGVADFTDPNLVNPWGIATTASSPFWVDDGGTGLSTVYSSNGAASSTHAIVPASATGPSTSTPTGIVANGTGGFAVVAGKNPSFIFSTAQGTISGWASSVDATHAQLMVDNSSLGAVYYGLAINSTTTTATPILYAPNFHSGAIDMFDTNYKPVSVTGAFADASVPSGYAPFNIWNIGGKLYVTYAKQDAAKQNSVAGAGNGYVAVFDLSGNLIQHLVSGGQLNAPWGVAIAPATFGAFANDLLVGNFGDGAINAYDPNSGAYIGALQDPSGNTIHISGLWALIVGNGGSGGDVNAVYFAAGIGGEQHGLLGSLQAAPIIGSNAIGNAADVQPAIAANTYVGIYGDSLAATTRTWATRDFVGSQLPTSLDGVGVMFDGKPAYVYYISPKQVDVLTPVDPTTGPVQVVLTNNGLVSGSATVTMQQFSPAFFLLKDGQSIAALHSDNVSLVGATTLYAGASTPAAPGETIVLFGTGFGPTNPAIPNGQIVTTPAALVTTPTITFGGVNATVVFAGLSSAGLYQFNVTVPPSTPDGNAAVVATIGSVQTAAGTIIAVLHP